MNFYTILSSGEKEYVKVHYCTEPIENYAPQHFEKQITESKRLKGAKTVWWNVEPIFCDTETSHIGETVGWVHQWACAWGGAYIIGRTARELAEWLLSVARFFKKHTGQHGDHRSERKTLVYIHNLAYDWCYFRDYLPEQTVFAVKSHKVLSCRFPGMEIRCSYLLTNNRLAKWAENTNARHRKLEETYDYDRVIFPDDDLSESDWAYQLNDVASMRDAWKTDRLNDGYTVSTVPLTSTGFIRAYIKETAETTKGWDSMVQRLTPDYYWYRGMEKAYQAGYTHGNRYENETYYGETGHRDFTSSFPARMILDKFPMGKWSEFTGDLDKITHKYTDYYAMIIHLRVSDLHLKSWSITAPMLGFSKLEHGEKHRLKYPVGVNATRGTITDNGRIISYEGVADYWCTDVDYHILREQYNGNFELIEAIKSRKEQLPKEYRELIMVDFRNKTNLDPKINPDSDEILYIKSKNRLNSYYGVLVQKTAQDNQVYNIETMEWSVEKSGEGEYNKRAPKLNVPFCWGVWVTAYARLALLEAIKTVGYEQWLYADTDSIFYKMTDEAETAIEQYNQKQINRAKKARAYCGSKYLGGFTLESDAPCSAFRQLHSKCYALIDRKGELKVTIAGVNKSKTRFINGEKVTKTNADELGNIEHLFDGFVFEWCGGQNITYNNAKPHWEVINGHRVEIASSAVISDTTYKVNDNRMRGELDNMEEILDWVDGGANYDDF